MIMMMISDFMVIRIRSLNKRFGFQKLQITTFRTVFHFSLKS